MTNRRASGFTLIELMVVVAVVAILATIAYPSYQAQMRKSRRAEAISALQDLQLRQERWRVDHATYATTFTGMPTATQYEIAMTGSATGYTLTATPAAGTSQARDSCGTLTLTSSNNTISKSPSGSACW